MKNIEEIAKFMQSLNWDEIDITSEWNVVDYHTNINLGLDMSEEEYIAREKELDEIEIVWEGYRIYAWYDVSGYDYWVKQQEEDNYVVVTLEILDNTKDWIKEELIEIDQKIYNIYDRF